jgi:hypothetical protein
MKTLLLVLAVLGAAPRANAQASEDALFGGGSVDAGSGSAIDAGSGEAALFGGGPTAAPAPSSPGTQAPVETENDARQSESEILGGQTARAGTGTGEVIPDDPLKIGGTLYLRTQMSAYDSTPPRDWGFSAPNLLDVYLDGRPNSRVRAFLVGRLNYDPTIDPGAVPPGAPPRSQANAVLDQLWLNFDILRTVFITAGKQHVKWGTGRFWNPTDFLQPVRLNALAVFDERTGVTMVKAHVPWEARGWNFYAFALLEGKSAVNVVQNLGGAARAEIVLGPAELGLSTAIQQGRKPRFGADLSSGVGPFDLYVEAAFKGQDGPRLQLRPIPDFEGYQPGSMVDLSRNSPFTELVDHPGVLPQVTAGGNWSTNLSDKDALTVGVEGFYNSLGYDDAKNYLPLLLTGQFTPFYLGKYYGAVYGLVQLPRGQVVNSFVLSTLSNLSDQSYITRLDYSVTVLTHLRVELYGDVHYGNQGGEFRFSVNPERLPPSLRGFVPEQLKLTPLFDVGVALRVSI